MAHVSWGGDPREMAVIGKLILGWQGGFASKWVKSVFHYLAGLVRDGSQAKVTPNSFPALAGLPVDKWIQNCQLDARHLVGN